VANSQISLKGLRLVIVSKRNLSFFLTVFMFLVFILVSSHMGIPLFFFLFALFVCVYHCLFVYVCDMVMNCGFLVCFHYVLEVGRCPT